MLHCRMEVVLMYFRMEVVLMYFALLPGCFPFPVDVHVASAGSHQDGDVA